jgi:predicted phosphate transport protein (TIGR00153 family)
VRLRLTPRNASFFDLLAEQAQHLVRGADLLTELIGAQKEDRRSIATKLREAEHEADEATHTIMRNLNQTFVTPFDRDDIYTLASRLDDCMDFMEEAGDLVVLYELDELPKLVTKQVDVLRRCAELTADAMPRLRSMKGLTEYWVEINRLENEADRTYRRLVADLFNDGLEPILLMKLKDVIDALEAAADAFERAANLVETIALKES